MRSALWVLLWCFLSALIVHEVKSEYTHSSSEHLKELIAVSVNFAEDLKEYVENHEKSNKKLKSYLKEVETLNDFAVIYKDKFVGNVLDAYSLIRTLTYSARVFDLVKNSFKNQNLIEFYRKFNDRVARNQPKSEDFVGALSALRRVVELWDFNSETIDQDFNRFATKTGAYTQLGPFDYIELARYYMNTKEMHLAYAFATNALKAFDNNVTSPLATRKDAYALLSDIAFYQDNYKKAIDYTNEILKISPKNKQALDELQAYTDLLNKMNTNYDELDEKEMIKEPVLTQSSYSEIKDKYREMCRDETNSYVPKGKLSCKYVRNKFNKIYPFKAEQLSKDPNVWMFYDTVTENQANELKELAAPKMKANTQYLQFMNGKIHNFEFKDEPVLKQMESIAKVLTNLNLEHAEDLQVVNYGIAGHYMPHYDYNNNQDDPKGNRLATLMTYLSAPDQGGETVFLELGLKIKPIKYASVFWFNLDKRYQPDERTLHAACPVLAGHKWIANKWIREKNN